MGRAYGLIFDVDGVIADTECVNARVSVQVFADCFGVAVRPEDFRTGLGRGAHAYIRAAAEVHGLALTDEQVGEAVEQRQRRFLAALAADPLPPYPGVLELITSALASADVHPAIATSSTAAKSRAALTGAGVPFDRMVYVHGDHVTHKKPHPELFLRAAAELNLTPARCLVIEDAPNGVAAARAAGAACLAVTNTSPASELAAADRICASLADLDLEALRALIDAHASAPPA